MSRQCIIIIIIIEDNDIISKQATYFSPRFWFKWFRGLIWWKKKKTSGDYTYIWEQTQTEQSQGWWQKCTFWGLMAATGGDPGGLCVAISVLKVLFAICMHSSRVLRNVVHVDFTMFPVSVPVWRNSPQTYTLTNTTTCPSTVVSAWTNEHAKIKNKICSIEAKTLQIVFVIACGAWLI